MTYDCQVLEGQRGGGRRLLVERTDGKDGIGWDELQRLKSEYLGPDVVAVEVYPAESDVVNERNRRHLWEVPDGFLPFTLRM